MLFISISFGLFYSKEFCFVWIFRIDWRLFMNFDRKYWIYLTKIFFDIFKRKFSGGLMEVEMLIKVAYRLIELLRWLQVNWNFTSVSYETPLSPIKNVNLIQTRHNLQRTIPQPEEKHPHSFSLRFFNLNWIKIEILLWFRIT